MTRSLLCTLLLAITLGSAPGATAQTANCAEPDVLIVFDVSGSMGKAAAGTKYTLATEAITTFTASLDTEVRFGLLMFPDPDGMYCDLDSTPQVPLGLASGAEIADLLVPEGANFYGGPKAFHDTPMFQALNAVFGIGDMKTPERRHYVVLITDGNQDCCIAGDYDTDPDCVAGSTDLDPTEAAQNIQDLVSVVSGLDKDGIRTFVVGLQEKVSAVALNQMAVAGGTAKDPGCNTEQTDPAAADNCYYVADDQVQLESALSAIVQVINEETCDGLDNDCDGETDEEFVAEGLGAECDGPDSDECSDGTLICGSDTTSIVCLEPGEATQELCNALDDDCDGETDEGELCAEDEICIGGACQPIPEDQPGTTGEDTAGETTGEDTTGEETTGETTGEDQPATEGETTGETTAEDTPTTGEETTGGGTTEDQPTTGEETTTGEPEPQPNAGGPALTTGPEVPPLEDDEGCGCRTVGQGQNLPAGGALISLLMLLGLSGLRRRVY